MLEYFCVRYVIVVIFLFFVINNFLFYFFHTTQHSIQNITKQQTHTQHIKVQSKGRERGKDNKNTKVVVIFLKKSKIAYMFVLK